jgi:superfamily II DNA or RNA helicase
MTGRAATERWSPGRLASARGRPWIVLAADPTTGLVELRPLADPEQAGTALFLDLRRERIAPASFPLPDPQRAGDATGALALFDASRLLLRDAAALLRGLGRIACTPRPYQYVPLLLALRQPGPVRLLIADDVGVGKTIEAALVARELVDRGLARRLGVLCPAHLVEQWTRELEEKFAFRPDRIQPATMAALERRLPRPDASVYAFSDCFVASIDFVKGERRREPFLRDAPDLVIVDEAHGCARPAGARSRGQQQRFDLLARLVEREMHLVLVTATPHAGIEESFRSLLGLLHPAFDGEGRLDRRRLRPFLVQRRRRDVARWLGPETPFPDRRTREVTYRLGAAWARLFEDVLDYCRARVSGPGEHATPRQRVRHWAAIALLRCVLSSPRAASTVLARRAGAAELLAGDEDPESIDARFRPELLDALDETPTSDLTPSAPLEAEAPTLPKADRRRLHELARRAASLEGPHADPKLEAALAELRELLARGFAPIVFCRFVPTATYLAEQLARAMPDVAVAEVTGELPDELRRERVEELARAPRRILVATDCLSEGINLQDHFDAVVHYDLPWNPNRLEQREGRVDRFGQPKPRVEAVVLYGADNEVDLAVLEVLIRKARRIREVLGVAVPVPAGAEEVLDAVVSSVLLRRGRGRQLRLAFEADAARPLLEAWDRAAKAEAEDRTYFAQEGIRPEEVQSELAELDRVLGSPAALERFLRTTLPRLGGFLWPTARPGRFLLHPGEAERELAAAPGRAGSGRGLLRPSRRPRRTPSRPHASLRRTARRPRPGRGARGPRPGLALRPLRGAAHAARARGHRASPAAPALHARGGCRRPLRRRGAGGGRDPRRGRPPRLRRAARERGPRAARTDGTRGPRAHRLRAAALARAVPRGRPRRAGWHEPVTGPGARHSSSSTSGSAPSRARRVGCGSRPTRPPIFWASSSCSRPWESGRELDHRDRRRPLRPRPARAAHDRTRRGRRAKARRFRPREAGAARRRDPGGLRPGALALAELRAPPARGRRGCHRADRAGGLGAAAVARARLRAPLPPPGAAGRGRHLPDFARRGPDLARRRPDLARRVRRETPLVPIHLAPFEQELDSRGEGRRSPHGLLQDCLDRTDLLWGLVSNGRRLRLLRANARTTRQAFLEVDLEAIARDELYPDFALLFRLLHRSRFPKSPGAAHECLLERWYQRAIEEGGRVREKLREGVERALEILGTGFLAHPESDKLRAALAEGRLSPEAFRDQLLALVYRLLFLLTAEERRLLARPDEKAALRCPIYERWYGISRLRERAERRRPDPYADLWIGLTVLFRALDEPEEAEKLGLCALDGDLFAAESCSDLEEARIANDRLLEALFHLSTFEPEEGRGRRTRRGPRRRVRFSALDVEELGSVYESLLELHPVVEVDPPRFAFVAGQERKSTAATTPRTRSSARSSKAPSTPCSRPASRTRRPRPSGNGRSFRSR